MLYKIVALQARLDNSYPSTLPLDRSVTSLRLSFFIILKPILYLPVLFKCYCSNHSGCRCCLPMALRLQLMICDCFLTARACTAICTTWIKSTTRRQSNAFTRFSKQTLMCLTRYAVRGYISHTCTRGFYLRAFHALWTCSTRSALSHSSEQWVQNAIASMTVAFLWVQYVCANLTSSRSCSDFQLVARSTEFHRDVIEWWARTLRDSCRALWRHTDVMTSAYVQRCSLPWRAVTWRHYTHLASLSVPPACCRRWQRLSWPRMRWICYSRFTDLVKIEL